MRIMRARECADGYSMASIVMSFGAAAALEKTHAARISAFRASMGLWVRYGREFLPNCVYGWPCCFKLLGALVEMLEGALPADVSALAGRLHIVLTRVCPTAAPLWVVSEWSSRADLAACIRGSCYWPWQMDWWPCTTFRGTPVIDGGFVLKEAVPAQTAPVDSAPCGGDASPCASPCYSPCFVGNVGAGESAAIWFSSERPLLRMLGDQFRYAAPLYREADIAADIALGYQIALAQHRKHAHELHAEPEEHRRT